MTEQYILGISAFHHDSAAVLLRNGALVAAASEERFTRKKGDATFPRRAVEFCLRQADVGVGDLAAVGFYEKPLLKFERIIETYLAVAPMGLRSFLTAGPIWVKDKLHIDRRLHEELGYQGPILYSEHHEAHAASAFFPSPFEQAATLTMDGVGEWATASIGMGRGNNVEIVDELHWPDSLGLFYSAFTYYLGFTVNSDEYKVMGLAPYGRPTYVDVIYKELLELKDDGSFRLNQRYFNYLTGLTMTNGAFDRLFGGPPRTPESALTQREMDLARSVQAVCEEVMLRMARAAHARTGSENLCLAGGVALNCVGTGRLLREGPFSHIWIQPAAGDAGGALGVAQLIHHRHYDQSRAVVPGTDAMKGAYLGPEFTPAQIEAYLVSVGAAYERMDEPAQLDRIACALADGQIIGWFDGRMEFGPRALGSRSILGDPRRAQIRDDINVKVKCRERFRPFAPSVLRERVSDYFDLARDSPYMLLAAPVKEERCIPLTEAQQRLSGLDALSVTRSDIPAVTHVDCSARIQTVTPDTNPRYYGLIRAFEQRTACPVVINTSFNVRGEPMVCTPADAYRCFMRTDMDALAIGPFVLQKSEQPEWNDVEEVKRDIPDRRSVRVRGRRFGLTLSGALLVLAALTWWRGRPLSSGVLVVLALALSATGLGVPAVLGSVERAWMRLAHLISRVMTPVLLGGMYLLVITPVGFLRRALGGNPMVHPSVGGSYWKPRPDDGRGGSLRRQF